MIAVFYWNYRVQRNMAINSVNSILYDLNIEMDLLEHWGKSYKNDSYLEKNIKHLIFNKLVVLSSEQPPIGELQGVPLEALNRVIVYNKEHNLFRGEFEDAFQVSKDYLKNIENDVTKRIEERNEALRNPLKVKK